MDKCPWCCGQLRVGSGEPVRNRSRTRKGCVTGVAGADFPRCRMTLGRPARVTGEIWGVPSALGRVFRPSASAGLTPLANTALMEGFSFRQASREHGNQTYLPAFQSEAQAHPRFPGAHEVARWPRGDRRAPRQGSAPARGLTPRPVLALGEHGCGRARRAAAWSATALARPPIQPDLV